MAPHGSLWCVAVAEGQSQFYCELYEQAPGIITPDKCCAVHLCDWTCLKVVGKLAVGWSKAGGVSECITACSSRTAA